MTRNSCTVWMHIKLEKKEHIEILLIFRMLFRPEINFQVFQEVEGLEIPEMSRDIVPENSRCLNNCLFTTIGPHF